MSVELASLLVPTFASTAPVLSSLIVFAIAIASLTGEVPARGRTWLPRSR